MPKFNRPTAWTINYDAKSNRLSLQHPATGGKISGALSITTESQSEYGKHGAWRFDVDPAAKESRLRLLDGLGFRRGWLKPEIEGDTLRINLIPCGSLGFSGALIFNAIASLGAESYACRTRPAPNGNVVQMASGRADSLLNDSLFDIDQDNAIQFNAPQVEIKTIDPAAAKPTFSIQMTTPLDTHFSPCLEFSAMPNYYRERYVPSYTPITRKLHTEAPTGWMPWNVYFGAAGEKENLAEARIGAEKLKPYGLKYWYVESWNKNAGTNPAREASHNSLLHHEELFPSGMKDFADQVRRLGFQPGIWSCPFGGGDKEFYEARKDWFLHDKQGKPFGNWCGYYILDPSNPAVIRYIEHMYRVMTKEWGYVFHKVDGTSANNTDYSSVFYERPEVRAAFSKKCENPMLRITEAVRRGSGKDALILWCCGDPAGPEVPFGDAARIGADVVARFKSPQWRNYIDQARMTLVHLLHNSIIWFNDPDTLLVGNYASLDVARFATTVVGLPGQAMIAGDKLGELPKERMHLLQRVLPVCPTRPLDLFPIHFLKPVWTLKVRRDFAQWDVVSVFNFDEKQQKQIELRFAEIGLNPDGEYHVFDFWNQSYLGAHKDGVSLSLAPQSNALLAVHPKLDRPQFLSTDRHISQGGTSLKSMKWDAKRRTLSGATDLVGGETTSLFFHVPKGWKLTDATASTKQDKQRMLRLRLAVEKSKTVKWSLTF